MIFEGVRFSVVSGDSLSDDDKELSDRISELLLNNAAKLSDSLHQPTHCVLLNLDAAMKTRPTAELQKIHYVTPTWVLHSVNQGNMMETAYYSPWPEFIFSGWILAVNNDHIHKQDTLKIQGIVKALGGQVRDKLSPDVTHFISLKEKGPLYESAMKLDIPTLLPHFIEDSAKLRRLCRLDMYQFPQPKLLTMEAAETLKFLVHHGKAQDAASKSQPYGKRDFLKSQTVFFEPTIQKETLDKLSAGVKKASGRVVKEYDPDTVTISICEHRAGFVYVDSEQRGKTVGNVLWLHQVLETGHYTSPLRRLLHYPTPTHTIPAMSNTLVTVSGYTGTDRRTIEKLCLAMGVSFTRFLTPTHTHLVSAVSSGEKFERAAEWGIHVVNSLWLEECFVKWERVREAQVRFMTFGTGVGVNGSVGDVTRWVSEAEIGLTMDEKAKLIRHTSLSNAEKTVMEKASANAKETDKMPGGKQNGAAYISPLGQSSRIAAVAQSSVSPAPKTPTPQTQQQQQEPKSSKTAATVTSTTKKKRALEPVTELLSSGGTKKRSRLATTSPTSSEELRVIFTGCRPSSPHLRFLTSSSSHKITLVSQVRDATLVVAEKLARTEKLLVAISLGKEIVSLSWVTESVKQERVCDYKDYKLIDTQIEKKYKFKLSTSLQRSRQGLLLVGVKVLATPKVAPDSATLKSIVQAAGGEFIDKWSRKELEEFTLKSLRDPTHHLILSTTEDLQSYTCLRGKGVKVYTSEVLLTGLLRQEVPVGDKEMIVSS